MNYWKKIQLAIGMKVIVTQNVETDLDITNGTRGTILRISLVQFGRTRVAQLAGLLPPCVIPVAPVSKSFTITVMVDAKPQNRTIKRRRLRHMLLETTDHKGR